MERDAAPPIAPAARNAASQASIWPSTAPRKLFRSTRDMPQRNDVRTVNPGVNRAKTTVGTTSCARLSLTSAIRSGVNLNRSPYRAMMVTPILAEPSYADVAPRNLPAKANNRNGMTA